MGPEARPGPCPSLGPPHHYSTHPAVLAVQVMLLFASCCVHNISEATTTFGRATVLFIHTNQCYYML
ncbi:hypothetical protein ACLKA6_009776 [Drosophila palustris]